MIFILWIIALIIVIVAALLIIINNQKSHNHNDTDYILSDESNNNGTINSEIMSIQPNIKYIEKSSDEHTMTYLLFQNNKFQLCMEIDNYKMFLIGTYVQNEDEITFYMTNMKVTTDDTEAIQSELSEQSTAKRKLI